MNSSNQDNAVILFFNLAGVVVAYVMLGASLYLSTEVPLATKGYWAIGVLLLTVSLVNFVKYRFDQKASDDRINQIEAARTEKLLTEFSSDK